MIFLSRGFFLRQSVFCVMPKMLHIVMQMHLYFSFPHIVTRSKRLAPLKCVQISPFAHTPLRRNAKIPLAPPSTRLVAILTQIGNFFKYQKCAKKGITMKLLFFSALFWSMWCFLLFILNESDPPWNHSSTEPGICSVGGVCASRLQPYDDQSKVGRSHPGTSQLVNGD